MSERIICNEAGGELREEVVRCRDCAYFASDEIGKCCTLMDFEDASGTADGFCAWGKRREEPTSDELWHVKCDGANSNYYCVMGFGAFVTEAEAIAAWNRRAER